MKRKFEQFGFTDEQDISPHLYCSICRDVFYKPARASCGFFRGLNPKYFTSHTFCSECLIRWTILRNICPYCRKKLKGNNYDKDFLATAIIDDLKVRCLKLEYKTIPLLFLFRCKWEGKFSEFKYH